MLLLCQRISFLSLLVSVMDASPSNSSHSTQNPANTKESTSQSLAWASKFEAKDIQTYKNSHVPVLPYQGGKEDWDKNVSARLEVDGDTLPIKRA